MMTSENNAYHNLNPLAYGSDPDQQSTNRQSNLNVSSYNQYLIMNQSHKSTNRARNCVLSDSMDTTQLRYSMNGTMMMQATNNENNNINNSSMMVCNNNNYTVLSAAGLQGDARQYSKANDLYPDLNVSKSVCNMRLGRSDSGGDVNKSCAPMRKSV